MQVFNTMTPYRITADSVTQIIVVILTKTDFGLFSRETRNYASLQNHHRDKFGRVLLD